MTLLLLLCSEGEQCGAEDLEPDDRYELRRTSASEFLIYDNLFGTGAAAAAELGRPCSPDEACLVASCLPFAQVGDPLIERVRQL